MTVQKLYVKNKYFGDGANTVFPITFEWAKKHPESIQVWVRNNAGVLTKTDNFLLKTSSNEDVWNVVYPSVGDPLGQGETITIVRELSLLQVLNLVNQGPFFAEDVEITFDELVMMIQQLNEKLARSFKVAVDIDGENTFDTTVPIEPGKSFRVKDDGTGFEITEDPAQVLPLAKSELEAVKREHGEAVQDLTVIKDEVESAKTDAQSAANRAEQAANTAAQEAVDTAQELMSQYLTDTNQAKNDAQTAATTATESKDVVVEGVNYVKDIVKDITPIVGTITNIKVKTDGYVTPQEFYNNEATWDNAISQAINKANTEGKVLYFPIGEYNVANGVVVDVPIDVIMDGTLVYNGDGIALTIGNASASISNKTYKVMVKAESFIDNENSYGVKFINLYTCNITVEYVSNYYNNVLFYADNGKGCCYNQIYLGHINTHKYGLTLSENNNGWTNENTFFGGRIYNNSTDKYKGNDVAILLTSDRTYKKNNNVFYHPCFEGSHIGIQIDYGSFNYFYDCRAENVDITLYSAEMGSSRNIVTVGYGNIVKETAGINTVLSNNADFNKVYPYTIYASNLCGKVAPTKTSGYARVDELYCLDVPTMSKSSCARTRAMLDGVITTSTSVMGLLVDTAACKDFLYEIYGENVQYRSIIVQFDENGNKIEDKQNAPATMINALSLSATYENSQLKSKAWYGGSNITEPQFRIKVSNNCVKAFIGIVLMANSYLKRFALKGKSATIYERMLPYLSTTAIPTGDGTYDGQVVKCSTPTDTCLGWMWYNGQWNVLANGVMAAQTANQNDATI